MSDQATETAPSDDLDASTPVNGTSANGSTMPGLGVARFLAGRLLAAGLVLVLVSVIVFGLVLLIPGDPAVTLTGEFASDAAIAQTSERLGLNDPILTQYWRWASRAVQGDLGESLRSGTPVSTSISGRLPATLSLAAGALVVTLLVSLGLGTLAGMRRNTWVDHTITGVASAAVAMPPFWVGLLLVILVAQSGSWFPATRYSPLNEGVGDWVRSLVLPSIALGLAPAGEATRQVRGAVAAILDQDFIRSARAKGLRNRTIIVKHVLFNSATTVLTVVGLQITILLGGTVLVEQVFNFQGIGSFAYRAVQDRDLPAIQGVVVLLTVFVLAINLLVDIANAFISPRQRAELLGRR